MSQQSLSRGWIVTLAGTGINLALGVLYSWSTIKKAIPKDWGWTDTMKSWPYTIACLVFALMMVPAGKLQDKYGPRIVASLGGILCGVGLIIASRFNTLGWFILGFGIFAGTGIGFGYASATPPAVKWFPPAKTGMIAGIVVAGFGLASAYISPLVKYLTGKQGVPGTLFILGIAFLIVVVVLSQFLVNPPPQAAAAQASPGKAAPATAALNYSAGEMLKTPQFYLLWIMFVFNAGAGLMIIGQLTTLVKDQTKSDLGFLLVALLAIGNAGGRLLAGTLSDKLGRNRTLQIFVAAQALLMFITPSIPNLYALVVASICIGMCYGSNLALFPSITKDFYGLKNFGINYGLVFTAWGIGSLMALIAGAIHDKTGSYQYALYLSGVLLIVSIALSFALKKPATAPVKECAGCKSAVPEETAVCPNCGAQMA